MSVSLTYSTPSGGSGHSSTDQLAPGAKPRWLAWSGLGLGLGLGFLEG